MQIHRLHSGAILLSPYQNSSQVSNNKSAQNLSQQAEENQQTSPKQTDPSNKTSEQVTGKEALQKTPEAAKSMTTELDLKDLKIVQELKKRDLEVRAHESAHLAAAGPYAKGGPTYTYNRGPDGRQYAVGGEVQIDTSEVPDNPEATIQKARVIRSAANAPANPSAQDRAVASQATAMEAEARKDLTQQRVEEGEGVGSDLKTNSNEKVDANQASEGSTTEPQQGNHLIANKSASLYPSAPPSEDQTRKTGNLINLTA